MKDTKSKVAAAVHAEGVRQKVRQGYGQIAQTGGSCCGSTPECRSTTSTASEDLARHIGYSAEELAALPDGANMGLSCGNPNALAALQPGEVVLDLGSGGGFDVFIAGRKVGATGRVIGVDMTAEMVSKARGNSTVYREQTGLENVEFRLGEIEHLPVADASVDVVISNCVINLSPDKPQVWREIARVLKPGGRVAVSDIALLKPLPPAIVEMVESLVGCVAGAVLVSETEQMAREAGLAEISCKGKPAYVEGMVDWQDPVYRKIVARLPRGTKPGDYITSLEITARKTVASTSASDRATRFTPAAGELEAIREAIAANCEPCLKYHYRQAQRLGVSKADLSSAVQKAARVKDSPHRAILRLANRLTGSGLETAKAASGPCCGATKTKRAKSQSRCCG